MMNVNVKIDKITHHTSTVQSSQILLPYESVIGLGSSQKIKGTLTNHHLTTPSSPMLTLPCTVTSSPRIVLDVPKKYRFGNL